jgi:hypothetical protein
MHQEVPKYTNFGKISQNMQKFDQKTFKICNFSNFIAFLKDNFCKKVPKYAFAYKYMQFHKNPLPNNDDLL